MIRPARFMDAPAIERLIRDQHALTKYALRCAIDDRALTHTVMGLIGSMNQPTGTHVAVSVENGQVTGFVAGQLSRTYAVLDRYSASDVFLINHGRTGAALQLLDSYIEWARANPKVIEIGLSWTDAIEDSDRLAAIYARKGFIKVGEQFALRLDVAQELAA